ncbi:DUF2946 family protein [Salinisphaera sp. P385]|uniref:DUF2946 family protein n=1 Tax=Spectribacter acetivorans TaxID=3075603 RepID=A0ABU3B6M0_9GAMM|nr:DUF2946 family protein [Salinisphaera sp. P385]MDT0617909.1 DUF2946 family protein [Salinisphaera sp. P385]
MDESVRRAMARLPDVPDLYGWLHLDRRGRWYVDGERITHPRILAFIERNYAADDRGCWYFQNGPQRGYVSLEYTPLILRVDSDGQLMTHTGQPVSAMSRICLDEQGSLVADTPLGAGVIDDHDLEWALARLHRDGAPANNQAIAAALAQPDGATTPLRFEFAGSSLPVERLDGDRLAAALGFVCVPAPG